MTRPSESRKRLLTMIIQAKKPVSIKEVIEFENREKLWLGPGIDAIDFLYAKKALGIINIDPKTNQVEFIRSS